MATLNLNKAEFLKSAVSPSGFLAADLPCIVFAGKSNVGKSSMSLPQRARSVLATLA